ncbi:hypothetical protein [Gordonia rubripertincta]
MITTIVVASLAPVVMVIVDEAFTAARREQALRELTGGLLGVRVV